jgi:hypothetical protein
MLLKIRRARRLLLAGLATALFSGIGLTGAVAAEAGHVDRTPQAVSPTRTQEQLPGGDSTLPGVALALLLGSAALAWIVRRSAPASAAVAPDALAPVAAVPPRRQPAGTQPTPVRRPAAA